MVIIYPCSAAQLLNRDKFIDLIAENFSIIREEKNIKCLRIVLDKDDGSHKLPILLSFTRVSENERRIRTDIPKDAEWHMFVNKEELAKVKKYDAVEAVKDFLKHLYLIAEFSKYLEKLGL